MIDIDLINYYSELSVDKVIATFRGTINCPAGGSATVNHALPAGAGKSFWAGTYNLVGSSQQSDIGGMQYSGLTGVGLEARSYNGGILVRSQNGTGTTYTAEYNLAVIASPQAGVIPSIGEFAPRVVTYAFDSRENHQKISDEITRSSPSWTGTNSLGYTIYHTFGFSPRFRIFLDYTDGYMYDVSTAYPANINWIKNNAIFLSTANFPNGGTVYVRFYYD